MHKSVQLTTRFEAALVYATRLHAGQIRKDQKTPYIAHLLSVAALVLEAGGSEDEAIAALLHDAIEDQGGEQTRNQIRSQFGDRVCRIVEGCTESETLPKPPWQERKQQYLEQLRHASTSIQRVSLADKLHNARSVLASLRQEGSKIWTRFHGGQTKTLWFYHALVKVYSAAQMTLPDQDATDFLLQEFKRTIAEIEQYRSYP